jgi:predicted nucleic-acid-binding protein
MRSEKWKKLMSKLSGFAKGFIAGVVFSVIVFSFALGVITHHAKVREVSEYVERKQIIEELYQDYVSRDHVEFLDAIPGVRGAADGAAADFERRRDEILQRFRSGIVD